MTNPIVGIDADNVTKILIVTFDTVMFAFPIAIKAPPNTGDSDSLNA